ncbi:MAG TPA: twin-arginine translocation signal domain-containing protein [Candidatus Dormibacteraeota bacterium]|nr:twin-arginine translocation signal domain-containing protein [Candidatus Dormibacteraeota bacterium]
MKTIDRRDFLKMAGLGTAAAAAAAAAAALPVGGFFAWTKKDVLRFRAVTGMPSAPLPAYASYVVEGHVDLSARTGQLAKSIHAGAPEAKTGIVFPGTARSIRVTDVVSSGDTVLVTGEIANQPDLLKGESPSFQIQIDRSAGLARANFLGSEVVLRLDE